MRNIADPIVISNLQFDNYDRIIIIGDIHGCYDEFLNLLEKVCYNSNQDILISVGDLIAKGPKSTEVLNYFINNKNTFAVMGNHEYAVIRWHKVFKNNINSIPYGLKIGSEHQIFAKTFTNTQINYLINLPHILRVPKFNIIITHAGINPLIDINKNNSFDVMHVRNIVDNNATEYISKGTKWLELWNGEEIIIFGHDATRGIQKKNNAIGLDSACVYGKHLSCITIPNMEIISIPALRSYIPINDSILINN